MTEVRTMRAADLAEVTGLSTELGYPVAQEALARRFALLEASPGDAMLVAERDGRVIGWAHVQERTLLESELFAELAALVVKSAARRTGAGRALVEAALAWARARGLRQLRVRSNVKRVESHRFYPSLGFQLSKTSHVYERSTERDLR